MCKFSEPNRKKLGNAVAYIAQHARYPYKTEILKLLFLMEERMVQKAHVPFLGIPFNTWRMGPVSIDVFEELSDGPVLLSDFITLEYSGQGNKVTAKKDFCDDEFSDYEISMMEEVMKQYGWMNSDQLISETHKVGSLWYQSAECQLDEIREGTQDSMMTEGTLLYCDPFVFKNGAVPKPKYFIVLANTDDGVMVASLPTSKDHVPSDAEVGNCSVKSVIAHYIEYE